MVIQFLQNSGSEGARREFIYKYLKDVLPSNKTEEQQLRIVGRLLVEMNEEGLIGKEGLRWFVRWGYPTIFAQSDRKSDRFNGIRPSHPAKNCFIKRGKKATRIQIPIMAKLFDVDEKELLTIWLADKVLDTVEDASEVKNDGIAYVQRVFRC